MSDQALTSLAILTVNWDRGHDVIDSFVPLVGECLRRGGNSPVSALDLQRAVKTDFGLTIPIGALQGILARCQRRDYVRRANNVYTPVRAQLDTIEFAPNQAEALRQHRCLLDKLRTFARERYELEWTEEEADAALLGYLQENTLPVLAAATEGETVSEDHRLPRPRHPRHRDRTRQRPSHRCHAHPEQGGNYPRQCLTITPGPPPKIHGARDILGRSV